MPSIQTPPVSLAAKRPPGTISRPSVIFLTVLGMLAVMAVTSVPATAQATTILVTTSADNNDVDEDCTEGSDNCTLREAVNVAESGDTIEFADGIDPQLVASLGQILIAEKDVVIVGNLDGSGPGTTISGGEVGVDDYDNRLFEITDVASLTISNVILTGGSREGSSAATRQGGAIRNLGSLDATNVAFENNLAHTGGAIANPGGVAVVRSSTFRGNSADFGGAVQNRDGDVELTDSLLDDNSANVGGAILTSANSTDSSLTVRRSTISGNTANNISGGIDVQSDHSEAGLPQATAVVVDSTVSGNTAPLGGGISTWLGTQAILTLERSTVVGNEATGTEVGSRGGGGLYVDAGVARVRNSTFSGNSAAEGGAIFNSGAWSFLDLQHVTVVGNSAGDAGGLFQQGVFDPTFHEPQPGNGASIVAHSILADNTGGDCGGTASDTTGEIDIDSQGYNLDSDESCNQLDSDVTATDVMLGDLADNGGSTMTHLPLEGSPAIEGGLNPTCLLDVDQRGEPRPGANSGACDIGAVEVQIADEPDDEPDDEPEDEDTPELEPAEPVEAQPAVPVEAQPDFTG